MAGNAGPFKGMCNVSLASDPANWDGIFWTRSAIGIKERDNNEGTISFPNGDGWDIKIVSADFKNETWLVTFLGKHSGPPTKPNRP